MSLVSHGKNSKTIEKRKSRKPEGARGAKGDGHFWHTLASLVT